MATTHEQQHASLTGRWSNASAGCWFLRGFHALPVGVESLRAQTGLLAGLSVQVRDGDGDGDGGASAIGALSQPIKDGATTLLPMLVAQSAWPTPATSQATHIYCLPTYFSKGVDLPLSAVDFPPL
jgi:hypothetical protein